MLVNLSNQRDSLLRQSDKISSVYKIQRLDQKSSMIESILKIPLNQNLKY